jgi:hypothetical protein
MAIFKIKRFSHLTGNQNREDFVDAIDKFEDVVPVPKKDNFIGAVLGIGVIATILYAINSFFKSKSGSGKYKATEEEIAALKPEFPKEYEILRKIQGEVIKSCRYIFDSESSFKYFVSTLPSLLNLNGEEFITGWARETGKKSSRFAPILVMYDGYYVLGYDFDSKSWFFLIGNKEYKPKTSIWSCLIDEFTYFKKLVKEKITDPYVLDKSMEYLDTNIKLIKKYGKV